MACISSENVIKMFPVSFDRSDKFDRVLSEANLTDWIRGIVPNSADTQTNSPHSYVISYDADFGNIYGTQKYMEFILNGYYVKIDDQWLHNGEWVTLKSDDEEKKKTEFSVVVEIQLTPQSSFTRLYGTDNSSNSTFEPLKFTFYDTTSSSMPTISDDCYRLCILRKPANATKFIVPEQSHCILDIIDGGEIQ